MGLGFRCAFGFSVSYSNTFSERMERYNSELERHFREGQLSLQKSLVTLHDAVDLTFAGDVADTTLERGLDELRASNEHLTALGEVLVRTRAELFEQAGVDPGDPLVARDPYFRQIDYDDLHGELAAHGAGLSNRVLWDELAARLLDGGTRAGLRLLDRHVRELQSDLRSFEHDVEALRARPGDAMAKGLHGLSLASAAALVGYCRLAIVLTYFSLACERATQLYERSTEWTERIAMAS